MSVLCQGTVLTFASEDLVGGYCHHCHGEVPVPITPLPFVRLRVKNKQFSIHFSRVDRLR
jgi:hypothetical protein